MWFDALVILGTCAAAVVFGFFIYWIIIKIQKTLRTYHSNSIQRKSQTPRKNTLAFDVSSPKPPSQKTDYRPNIRRENDTETENDDWLNAEVPKISENTTKKEDNEWLNADVEEVPDGVYKQQDDEWLNAENSASVDTADESSPGLPNTIPPEIQIEQEGAIINITITTSLFQDTNSGEKKDVKWLNAETSEIPISVHKQQDVDWLNAENDQPLEAEVGSFLNPPPSNQREISVKQDGFLLNIAVSASKALDAKSEQTVTNLKISPPSKDAPMEEELPKDEEMNEDDSISSFQGIQDFVPVKSEEAPIDQNNSLMDEINVKPVESQRERQKEDRGTMNVA